MGGRGKWSQSTDTGFTWYDYHKVFQSDDIHFIVQHDHNEGGISSPVMSQTSNVTYVTLDWDNTPKCISVYKNRIKQYDIDLDKPHHGILPHIHHCNEKGYRQKEKDKDMELSSAQQKMVNKIIKIYKDHEGELKK